MAADQQRRPGIGGIGDGIRTGIGILNALREAVEETFQEAVNRGDMSPEGAKQAMRDVAQRLQGTFEEARERFEYDARREHEELRAEMRTLRERVERLERAPGAPGVQGATPDAPAEEPPRIIITD